MTTELRVHDLLWVTRRLPESVRNYLKESKGNCFLAGGFIRDCITRDPVTDIDLFVGDKEAAIAAASAVAGSIVGPEEVPS